MTTAFDAPHDELEGPYWNGSRIGLMVVVIAMIAMWGWIYLFAPRENADRLDNRDYPAQAAPICTAFQNDVDALPFFTSDTTVLEKAAQVDDVTEMTIGLVDELKRLRNELVFEDPDDETLIDLWLNDWDAYIADRQAYSAKLYDSENDDRADLVFTLTARSDGGQYTRTIEGFGNVNDMSDCHVPRDI